MNNTKIIKTINSLIEQIRPYLNSDGGDIEFIKYEDKYIYVKLSGSCSNCMFQDQTLNDGLLAFFKNDIPDVEGVINVPLS